MVANTHRKFIDLTDDQAVSSRFNNAHIWLQLACNKKLLAGVVILILLFIYFNHFVINFITRPDGSAKKVIYF